MNFPILSIIIPVYNVVSFVERCLASVESQTFHNYEILLIDDGSKDGSSDICKKYADKNPQKVRYICKTNEGQGPTRDLGVKMAKGKYITFLDADDWWAPDFCEQMIDAINKLDADIAVCDINYIDEDNNIQIQTISQIRLPEYQKIIPVEFPDSINRMRTFLWGKVFRRSLYIKSGLKQVKHAYEDFPVTSALVALSRSVCRVNRPMYFYYRSRKDSTINYLFALGCIPDSIRNMVENFNKLKLFETYSMYIEKMAFSQLRFAMRRMNILFPTGQDQYKRSLQFSLFKIMKYYFPNWLNPYGMNICVCGNDTLNKIVMSFLYEDADHYIYNDKKYDLIFLDSLNVKDAYMQNKHLKANTGKHVIVSLVESEKVNSRYDELKEKYPNAVIFFTGETFDVNEHIGETEIWNIADLIWFKLFSGNNR
ncbi:MAG: glycosyltransferase family 2 protein [Bacteroidales bacterium]|nr:glycosyltransferase family 2 protein [Bacteroidales bacterium]